ncbi:MAG: hypothetical protein AAGK97_02280 [Bacteroidota bacterium]
MKGIVYTVWILLILMSCEHKNDKGNILAVESAPSNVPIAFKEHLCPEHMLIHRVVFSPDLSELYFTLSDSAFTNFDVYVSEVVNGNYTNPQKAFFNSDYNEHGMSFSPDGKTLYFSSTRPTNVESIPDTWHIWKTERVGDTWTKPVFVDIPNMRDKLLSHPSISKDGVLYFHASNVDYSNMSIYSVQISTPFGNAKPLHLLGDKSIGTCTPYVAPNNDFLIFASIGQQLDLWINFKDKDGQWTKSKKLNENINKFGQGNPYITPDQKYLFYATGSNDQPWNIKWVKIELDKIQGVKSPKK